MLYTLMQLWEANSLPFIVQHAYRDERYIILAKIDDVSFSAKLLDGKDIAPKASTPKSIHWGHNCSYMLEERKEKNMSRTISPEEQKRLREEERRRNNELAKRRYNLLGNKTTRPAPPRRQPTSGTVIEVDFTKKK